MTKNDLLELVALALDLDEVDESASMNNLDDWDSLGHLSILTSLDKKLQGKASSISGLASATSISSIITLLKDNNLIDE